MLEGLAVSDAMLYVPDKPNVPDPRTVRNNKLREYWAEVKAGLKPKPHTYRRAKKTVESYIRLIKEIDADDAYLLQKYIEDKQISLQFFKKLTPYNTAKYIYYLRQRLGKSLASATKDDWKRVKSEMLVKYKWQSVNVMFGSLKAFYKWWWSNHPDNTDEGDYPPCIRFFKYERPKSYTYDYGRVMDWSDIERLVIDCDDPKTSALMAYLFDSGARISETVNLKWGDFEESLAEDGGEFLQNQPEDLIHSYHVHIREGEGAKTGGRTNRCYMSYFPLHRYRQSLHLKEREKDMPVWGKDFTDSKARKLLSDVKLQKDIHFRLNPHHFRHSSATLRARMGWSKARMDAWYGWSPNSNTASKYISLGGAFKPSRTDLKF